MCAILYGLSLMYDEELFIWRFTRVLFSVVLHYDGIEVVE